MQELDLSPTTLDAVGAGNASDELSLCYAWARDCHTLRHVIFPSKTEWMQANDETWFPLPPSPTTAYPPLLNY